MNGWLAIWLCMTLVLMAPLRGHSQPTASAIAILPQSNGVGAASEAGTTPEELDSDRYEKRIQPLKRMASPAEKVTPVSVPKSPTPNAEVSRPLDQASTFSAVAPEPGKSDAKPSVGDEMRDILIGGSPEDIQRYQNFLAPDDIRRNSVELEMAPGFLSNSSQSQTWARSYNSATPSGRIGLNVWFTPFLGVSTSYTKTFLGTVQKSFNSAAQTPSMDQWLTIGLRFRRFASSSQSSPGLTLGLDYSDYQRKLPADDLYRNRFSTSGAMLSAESRIPSSENVAWLFKIEYMPFMVHKEETLGREVKSGTSPQSFGAGLSLGPEFKMNRGNRVFLRSRAFYERNSFGGSANTANPGTGESPENVTVSNTFLFFEMGYIWGS